MLNQYAVDIPTLPVNLCLSHLIQFLSAENQTSCLPLAHHPFPVQFKKKGRNTPKPQPQNLGFLEKRSGVVGRISKPKKVLRREEKRSEATQLIRV